MSPTQVPSFESKIAQGIIKELEMLSKKLTGLVAVAGLFVAGAASAQIAGSAHDFSDNLAGEDAWNTGGEICAVCHTPHNGDATVSDAALWDHELTTATYQLYDSAYRSTIQGTASQPAGLSKLCLSCHDGTVGLDSFGGVTGTTNYIGNYVATADVTTDLRDDHPTSITYAEGTDPDLKASTSFTNVKLVGGSVECVSCHNVHNESGADKLLVVDNTASALCAECHSK